jgi:hypothetical protein
MSIIATPLVSRNDVQSVWAAASGQKALASGTLAKSNILKKCDVEYIQQKSNRQKKSWKVSREFWLVAHREIPDWGCSQPHAGASAMTTLAFHSAKFPVLDSSFLVRVTCQGSGGPRAESRKKLRCATGFASAMKESMSHRMARADPVARDSSIEN